MIDPKIREAWSSATNDPYSGHLLTDASVLADAYVNAEARARRLECRQNVYRGNIDYNLSRTLEEWEADVRGELEKS